MKNCRLRAKDLHTGRVVYMAIGGRVMKLTVVCKGHTRFIKRTLGVTRHSIPDFPRKRVLFERPHGSPVLMDIAMCKGERGAHLYTKEKQAQRHIQNRLLGDK